MPKKDFKKELSKELMYQKIMPSSANISDQPVETQAVEPLSLDDEEHIFSSPGVVPENQTLTESSAPLQRADQPGRADQTETTNSIENEDQAEIEAVTASSVELIAPKFTDGPAIVNLMEYLVDQRVDDVLAKFNCCDCSKCRKDTIALALNRLPPKYVVIANEQVIDFTQHKAVAEILTALIQAVLTVRTNPRHDAE